LVVGSDESLWIQHFAIRKKQGCPTKLDKFNKQEIDCVVGKKGQAFADECPRSVLMYRESAVEC
jgi:hypothetical protein